MITYSSDELNDYESGLDEDYEEGVMTAHVPVRKKWWQFWLPKNIDYDYCRYTKIGNTIKITIEGGGSFTGTGKFDEGE